MAGRPSRPSPFATLLQPHAATSPWLSAALGGSRALFLTREMAFRGTRRHSLTPTLLPSHGGNTGSNPVCATTLFSVDAGVLCIRRRPRRPSKARLQPVLQPKLALVDDAGRQTRRSARSRPPGWSAPWPARPVSKGSADGVGAAARFNFPTGIACDAARNLYVADNTTTLRTPEPQDRPPARHPATSRRVALSGTCATLPARVDGPCVDRYPTRRT